MAKKTIEICTCDICESDTDGFSYWEVLNSSLGVIKESRLVIDICEDCCKRIYPDIPDFMLQERGEDDNIDSEKVNKQVEKWKGKLISCNYWSK